MSNVAPTNVFLTCMYMRFELLSVGITMPKCPNGRVMCRVDFERCLPPIFDL